MGYSVQSESWFRDERALSASGRGSLVSELAETSTVLEDLKKQYIHMYIYIYYFRTPPKETRWQPGGW